jgi:ABC-type uncharacterized transport system permease subunit
MDALFFASLAISLTYLAVSIMAGIGFFTERRRATTAASLLAMVTSVGHLAFLMYIGINERKIPFTSFFEAMSVISLFLVLIYLVLQMALKLNSIGFFVFPLVFAFQTISTFGPRVMYLGEEFVRSPLFWFHTLSTLAGYAAFGYSMILGIMHLRLFRELKTKKLKKMYDRLPPLDLLEKMNSVALIGGFVFLTVGIILGSALAITAWGNLPLSDPKVLFAVLLWVLYVFGLIAQRVFRWGGKRMSYLSVVGFLVLIVAMLAVRLIENTFHQF